ncbi:hypothetical protein [Vibrio breoganii]|uniref:hypothetical protein n=1 Tax=Vibrio breoganii TaxID=553239 RepID=UPI00105446DC|nr:hypothetical protein [Vibrio breoganii]
MTLVAIMLSSVVNSAPLMPLQMLVDSQMTNIETSNDSHCASSHGSIDSELQECCGGENMSSEHQCCYSSCVPSYSVASFMGYELSQTSVLVPIIKDPISHVSSIANALFRPPIA